MIPLGPRATSDRDHAGFPMPEPAGEPGDMALSADTPLDIQHDTDPAHEEPPARRIPHLGHAALFFALAAFCVLVFQLVTFYHLHILGREEALKHPAALGLSQLVAYAATLALAVPIFRVAWGRPFLDGLHWNWRLAKPYFWRLIALALPLVLVATAADRFTSTPQHSDVELLLSKPLLAWLTLLFGSTVAPLMEEIAFRGFLLPAVAIAYDWLSLKRTPAAMQQWAATTNISMPAWIFSSVLTSILFAALHGLQLHGAILPVAVIFFVSLVFCAVRIRTGSLAAATILHVAYDAIIFIAVAIATGGFHHLDKL